MIQNRQTMELKSLIFDDEVVGFELTRESESQLVDTCYIRQAIAGKSVSFSHGILTFKVDDYELSFAGTTNVMQDLYHMLKLGDIEIIQPPSNLRVMIVKLRGRYYKEMRILGGSISPKTKEIMERGNQIGSSRRAVSVSGGY